VISWPNNWKIEFTELYGQRPLQLLNILWGDTCEYSYAQLYYY
jgi:hypothetical protein